MKPILSNNLKSLVAILSLFLTTTIFNACSQNSQSVQMLDAAPVTCELYGTCTKSFSLAIDQLDYINWAALDWSGEYKYFEITEIKIGQKTYEGDGSTHIFEKLTLSKSNVVTVTYTYSPLTAQEDVDTPHHATLKLVGASPQLATIQVDLTGYVQGVCDSETEECNFTSTEGTEAIYYDVIDGAISVYVCHPNITAAGADNDPDERPDVRYDEVAFDQQIVFYYSSEDSKVSITRNDSLGTDPTIPEFDIPLAAEVTDYFEVPIDYLTASLVNPSTSECDVDSSGGFECSAVQIAIDGNYVTIDDFFVTTGSITPITDGCDGFGTISGSSGINSESMVVVGWTEITGDALNKHYFDNALVVVEIPLQKAE